jgi:hypothetical protein
MANIIDSYSESNYNSTADFSLYNGSFGWRGQSFTGNGSTLGKVTLYARKLGTPTGSVSVQIFAHSGTYGTSSIPTGSALATSDSFDPTTLSSSYALTDITFSGGNQITLTNGTHYVFVATGTTSDGSNNMQIGGDNTSPTAAGNESTSSDGTTFTASSSVDLCFYVYDNAVVLLPHAQFNNSGLRPHQFSPGLAR